MDKMVREFKDLPFWVRHLIGWGYLSASRRQYQRIEIILVLTGASFLILFVTAGLLLDHPETLIAGLLSGVLCLIGAYFVSIVIRAGDKYEAWSLLEPTLPEGIFEIFRKKQT